MSYKAMYVPTSDQVWVDGCKYIDKNGEVFEYDASTPQLTGFKDNHRVAELMIVDMEFNCLKVVGRPAPESIRWVKNGTVIRAADADHHPERGPHVIWKIKCPTCGRY